MNMYEFMFILVLHYMHLHNFTPTFFFKFKWPSLQFQKAPNFEHPCTHVLGENKCQNNRPDTFTRGAAGHGGRHLEKKSADSLAVFMMNLESLFPF